MRRKDQIKKYISTTRPTHQSQKQYKNHHLHDDTREQLRLALEELEHYRLSGDLESQKRMLLQQQLKTSKQETIDLKDEIDELKRQIGKISKRYSKIKQKKICEQCKDKQSILSNIEKQREIYLKDRKIFQQQIKSLKYQLENSQAMYQRDQLINLTDALKKQLALSAKKIQQQSRIIHYMNEKLSSYQMQNIEIMNKVTTLENKLEDIQINNVIKHREDRDGQKKKHQQKSESYDQGYMEKRRKNGSIHNIKRSPEICKELQRYQH